MGIIGLAHALQREIQDQRMQVEPQTFRKNIIGILVDGELDKAIFPPT